MDPRRDLHDLLHVETSLSLLVILIASLCVLHSHCFSFSFSLLHWRCFATCVGHLHTLCVRDFKDDCENHRSESISEQNGATADRDLLEAVKAPNHELHSYIETEPHSYIATKAASTKGGGGAICGILCGYVAMWLCGYVAM